MERFIGLDAGSVSVKFAVLDARGNILETRYVRHKGNPLPVAYELLKNITQNNNPPFSPLKLRGDGGATRWSLSITGSAGNVIARAFGIKPVNEVVALGYSTKRLYPEVRTAIEMGGEDSKLILLENGMVREFSMNSACAAGTGSFIDQQAERLDLSIEEFSDLSLRSEHPPRIAGRCSVFAKSDMIHLQQIATPVEDIVAGLCFAVTRNFKGSICKNMELPGPISFQGGVAANKGVVRAFREVLNTDNIIIPEHFAIMPAIGAVLKDMEEGTINNFDIEKLKLFIEALKDEEHGHKPLREGGRQKAEGRSEESAVRSQESVDSRQGSVDRPNSKLKTQNSKLINAYLGIDIGSISTNLAVIDEEGKLLAKRYLMTAGRPIEAVKKGLEEIGSEVGDKVNILGVGTTGSGRYMIADFVGADIVKNEITAQATAAVEIDPEVDTIFEIGGQDSKYISMRDGIIVDFEMNKACAAGTGSFIEEQAEKLGILVKNEFAQLAFNSQKPCSLGERCTVFMENSLLSKQQKGATKEDLTAGLAYSIVQNYINRVVGDRAVGKKIFFQGGVAFNKSVVAAFENYLDRKIIVPPHHDVTGAIGMAIIAKKHMVGATRRVAPTTFKGFDLSKRDYEIKSFMCKGCDNLCEINRVQVDGEKEPLYYGSRCEKYDVKRRKNTSEKNMPDLFAEREELLTKTHNEYRNALCVTSNESKNDNPSPITHQPSRIKIGIPRIFFFQDFLPFWSTLLWELGFEVELSDNTNRKIINKGVENILAESCFPHKVAHGHIRDLIDKNVDAIFLPSFINFNQEKESVRSFACPYTQTMPYIAGIAFGKAKLIKPIINLERGRQYLVNEIYRSLKPFRVTKRAIVNTLDKADRAQKEFTSAIKRRGREVLEKITERTIVIVGRPYNAFDSGVNLEIPKKLAALGVFSVPMDYLPLETVDIFDKWANMYWRSGQNILRAAEIIRDNQKLFALYIGNFSCGPDSFIQHFFDETMSNKPFLNIEIDEHSADAGVITRCEAFLDSIEGQSRGQETGVRKQETVVSRQGSGVRSQEIGERKISLPRSRSSSIKKRVVYIPMMSDHAFGLAAAFEACGLEAEVMNSPDNETVSIGRRFVSGKECYPCAITTGDMVKKALSPGFNPDRAAFFMPSGAGPCRFGQYNVFHRLVLDEAGFPEVPIFSPNQDESLYTVLGMVGKDFSKQVWKGVIAIELLMKCLHETRPYEVNKGETDGLYQEYLKKISVSLKSGNGSMPGLFKDMRGSFSEIKKKEGKRPLIGVIGEIFVRHNKFANEDIIRKIEALGGEVWLAPVEEWLYYVNYTAMRQSVVNLRNSFTQKLAEDLLRTVIARHVQKKTEHKYSKPFEGFLKTLKEPSTTEILKNASPYLHDSFEGEAVLSMGKAVDFVKHGASGIISAMPFGCMPGTIVSALLKGLKQNEKIPCLSVAYDGVETTCSGIQLEAFMHQANECMKNKGN